VRTAPLQRRTLATGLATLLAFGAPVALAASSAHAVDAASSAKKRTVVSGTAVWGFKASWRRYMSTGGTITASGGATLADAAKSAPYNWQVAGGTVNKKKTSTISLRGTVTYSWPAHTIEEYSLINPTVKLRNDGTGTITATVRSRFGTSGAVTKTIVVANIRGSISAKDNTATLTTSSVTFTQAGIDSMSAPKGTEGAPSGGFYTAGDPIDLISAQLTLAAPAVAAPATKKPAKSDPKTKSTAETNPRTPSSATASASPSASKKSKASASPSASPSTSTSVTQSVAPSPSDTAVAADTTPVSSDGSSSSLWLLGLAVVLVAAGVGGFLVMRNRGSAPTA
jgi:hypothetical protein